MVFNLPFLCCFSPLQILRESTKGFVAARARRLREGPVGIHRGLSPAPHKTNSEPFYHLECSCDSNKNTRKALTPVTPLVCSTGILFC